MHNPTGRAACGQKVGCSQRNLLSGEVNASARSILIVDINRAVLQGHLLALQGHLAPGGLKPGAPQEHVATLGIQQQPAIHGEQAPLDGQIPLGGQAKLAEGGGVGAQPVQAQDGCPGQGGGGCGRGAVHVKATLPHPQAGGGGEVELLDLGEGAGSAEPDSPRGEPDEVGRNAQGDGLVDDAAQGVGDAHHHVAVTTHVEADAGDGAPCVKSGEAVKEVGPGGGAALDRTGPAEATASGTAIDHTAQSQGPTGGGDFAGGDGRDGQAQQKEDTQGGEPKRGFQNRRCVRRCLLGQLAGKLVSVATQSPAHSVERQVSSLSIDGCRISLVIIHASGVTPPVPINI